MMIHEPIALGDFPTPVQCVESLSTSRTALWVKRDDLSNPVYGGNKVRKLAYLLAQARAKNAQRILTIGAVGSHHVLATAIHGRATGLDVAAVLVAQPSTPGILNHVRIGFGLGLQMFPVDGYPQVAFEVARQQRASDFFIPPGGSSVVGSLGYFDAAKELAQQIQAGLLPEPDVIVVALGSAGTAAGLVAGVTAQHMRTKVLGVHVVEPSVVTSSQCLVLAKGVANQMHASVTASSLWKTLCTTSAYLGDGYGHPTEAGALATDRANGVGLHLDPTYTSKAFAAALDLVATGTHRNVLFWQTLSSASTASMLLHSPPECELPAEVHRLAV